MRKRAKYVWAFVGLTNLSSALPPRLARAFQSDNLAGFFNALFQLAIVVGAMIAVLRIAYAGFLYMTSDIFSQKEHAKEILRNALAGLLILMGIWLILRQINPDILNLDALRHVQAIPAVGNSPAPQSSPANTNVETSPFDAGPVPGIPNGQESQTAPYVAP